MEKNNNNNSRNSLVFGRWPQKKIQEILEGGCGGGVWVEISLTKAEGSGSIPVCHTN